MTNYKLNIKRDVDVHGGNFFETTDYILNTPSGYRINDSDIVHVRGFDSMAELKAYVKDGGVIPCDCKSCFPDTKPMGFLMDEEQRDTYEKIYDKVNN